MANSYIEEGKKLDYFITPSKYAKDALTSAFKLDTSKIIEVCYPRTYELDNQVKTKIKEELKIDRKVILYAPTWRDDSSSIKGYTFEYILDFSMFDEQFKQEYQILYRPHYLIKDKVDLSKYQDFVIDVSKYPEINDLYNISDLLISDYSSVYFDYAYFNKPIYFYMPDLSHYKDNLRDFYIDIDLDLPNDYTQTQTELIKQITSNYINKVKYDNFIKNNQLYESNLRLILDKLNI